MLLTTPTSHGNFNCKSACVRNSKTGQSDPDPVNLVTDVTESMQTNINSAVVEIIHT